MLFLPAVLLLLWHFASGYSIENENDLVKLSERVNVGNTFQGMTIYLQSDLDMSGIVFDPIGDNNEYDDSFMGTFDGQGYVISNLNVSSQKKNTLGLFGYCVSATLKSFILDSSCVVNKVLTADAASSGSSSHTETTIAVGAVVGSFDSQQKRAVLDGVFNQAKVTVSGEADCAVSVGGMLGLSKSFSETVFVKNCANLGDVTFSGTASIVNMGGIAGGFFGNFVASAISNTINAGAVAFTDFPSFLAVVGGVLGYGAGFIMTNCVNAGKIPLYSVISGALVGMGTDSAINTSYYESWSSGVFLLPVGLSSIRMSVSAYPFDENFVVYDYYGIEENHTLTDLLNAHIDAAFTSGYSRWALNRGGNNVYYTLYKWKGSASDVTTTTTSSSLEPTVLRITTRVIILLALSDSGTKHFDGWYTDKACTESFTGAEVTGDTSLYANWGEWPKVYTVSFDTGGSEYVAPITAQFGTVVSLPRNISRGTEVVGGWADPCGVTVSWDYTVAAYDIQLTAVWLDTVLSTPAALASFAAAVGTGMDCKGVTVYLDADLDMNNVTLLPIGSAGSGFTGTFDGRGHVISNLTTKSTQKIIGLFGYSQYGMTVRNVILGKDCVLSSSYDDTVSYEYSLSKTYLGGIVGYCTGVDNPCIIANVISMASLDFLGTVTAYDDFMCVGGIVGGLVSQTHESRVSNSAFVGHLIVAGRSQSYCVGGIVGSCSGSSLSSTCTLINCLSTVNIAYAGTSKVHTFIGGVAGLLEESAHAINCVTLNTFLLLFTTLNRLVIGNIAGSADEATIENCYWRDDSDMLTDVETAHIEYPVVGSQTSTSVVGSSAFNKEFGLTEEVTAGNIYAGYSLISALNAYTLSDGSLGQWALNRAGAGVTFTIKRDKKKANTVIKTKEKILLFQNKEDFENDVFFGWYKKDTTSAASSSSSSSSSSEQQQQQQLPLSTSSSSNIASPHGHRPEQRHANDILFTGKEVGEDGAEFYGFLEKVHAAYNVSFFIGDGICAKVTRLAPGELLSQVTFVPERKGYAFVKWIDERTTEVTASYTMPKRHLKLSALWLKTRISSPDDLLELSDSVNAGVDCMGQTVYLDSDIDMGGISGFEPIGSDFTPFVGTFEGQGHRISNLHVENAGEYVGLFGVSYGGAEFRNLFLDETCAVISTYLGSHTYAGGLIGYCYAVDQQCTIINVVNFGRVESTGASSENSLAIGGIAGACKSVKYECVLFNCANYGPVTQSGKAYTAHIGGILGKCTGDSTSLVCKVWNSLNYGLVVHNGTTPIDGLEMGGIVGTSALYTRIASCVNAGDVSTARRTKKVNPISGNTDSTSDASGNLWYEETSAGDYTGLNIGIQEDLVTENGVAIAQILGDLSAQKQLPQVGKDGVPIKDYAPVWLINGDAKKVTLYVNGRRAALYTTRVVLLPTLIGNEEYSFDGWHSSSSSSSGGGGGTNWSGVTEIYNDIELYGTWKAFPDKSKDKWIVLGVVLGLVIIIVASIAAIYGKEYFKRMRAVNVLRALLYPSVYDADSLPDSLNNLKDFYPVPYPRPTLKEALYMAGLGSKEIEDIADVCYKKARSLEETGALPEGLTVDDAAAIVMYTYRFGSYTNSSNPYCLLYAALVSKSEANLQKIKGIMYLVMSALRKIPVIHGKTLHRGIRAEVDVKTRSGTCDDDDDDDVDNDALDRFLPRRTYSGKGATEKTKSSVGKNSSLVSNSSDDDNSSSSSSSDSDNSSGNDEDDSKCKKLNAVNEYAEGSIITWDTLISSSLSLSVTKSFLAKGSITGKSAGTLFIVEDAWGYDIQMFSLYPMESEVLIEPERQFEVVSIIQSEGFTIIKLRMLKTPLVLPNVFGKHSLRVSPLFFVEERVKRHKEKTLDSESVKNDQSDSLMSSSPSKPLPSKDTPKPSESPKISHSKESVSEKKTKKKEKKAHDGNTEVSSHVSKRKTKKRNGTNSEEVVEDPELAKSRRSHHNHHHHHSKDHKKKAKKHSNKNDSGIDTNE